MKREYYYDREQLRTIEKSMYWTVPFNISLGVLTIIPLVCLFIMLSNRGTTFGTIVYLFVSAICDYIVSRAIRDDEIKLATIIQLGRIGAAFVIWLIVLSSDIKEYRDCKEVMIIGLIFLTVNVTFCILSLSINSQKYLTLSGNLSSCYLKLNDTGLTGVSFSNLNNPNDANYFELPYDEIRSVRAQNNGYCNLLIDYPGGTYRLSVENNTEAINCINKIINNIKEHGEAFEEENNSEQVSKPVKETYKTTPKWESQECGTLTDTNPCPNCGSIDERKTPMHVYRANSGNTIICPNCNAKQISSRYFCYHCGQVFVNGQPNIPYWCGNCGKEGPYEGNCPVCGKSIKIYNTEINN